MMTKCNECNATIKESLIIWKYRKGRSGGKERKKEREKERERERNLSMKTRIVKEH